MRINTLAATTAIILALSMGAAHALESSTSAETTSRTGVTVQRGTTTTTLNADGTWSEIDPSRAETDARTNARTSGGLSSSVTGGALSSNITGGALSSTSRSRSNTTVDGDADLGINAELGTRNSRAGVRAGSNAGVGTGGNTGVGIGGNAGVGVGIGR